MRLLHFVRNDNNSEALQRFNGLSPYFFVLLMLYLLR